jgi:hypothetical protein
MKFGYRVKHNDRWYAPGEEIPLEKPSETKKVEKTEKPKKTNKKTKGE